MSQKLMKRHARLVDEMANTLGVDLEEATMRGNIPMDDLSDLVLKCRGCVDPDACENWLKARARTGADRAPGFCRSAKQLEGLRVEG